MVKLSHLVKAGVAGLVGGKLASLARDNPETAKPLLLCTAASSAVGVATGICVAWYRKAPLHVYAISVGTNFAVSSFAFFSMRQTLLGAMQSSDPLTLEPEGYTSSLTNMIPVWSGGQEYLSSAASGGIAGSLASLISRHMIRMVVWTGVGGVFVGLMGQWSYFKFQHWRKKRGLLLMYPELAPPSHKKGILMTFQDWFLGFFWDQRSKASQIAAEIELLERDIAREQKRIAALDREIQAARKGVSMIEEGNWTTEREEKTTTLSLDSKIKSPQSNNSRRTGDNIPSQTIHTHSSQ